MTATINVNNVLTPNIQSAPKLNHFLPYRPGRNVAKNMRRSGRIIA